MFDWQHFGMLPFLQLLWRLCTRCRNIDLRNVNFLIRKTEDGGEFHIEWGKKPSALPPAEEEKLALPAPKSSKRRQGKKKDL